MTKKLQKAKPWEVNPVAVYLFDELYDGLHPLDLFLKKNPKSSRLRLFKHKGLSCVRCGVVADRIITWQESAQLGTDRIHVDLFASRNDGSLVMMTKDHIIPRSKGGPHALVNLQPMCSNCNEKKADKDEPHYIDIHLATCGICGWVFPVLTTGKITITHTKNPFSHSITVLHYEKEETPETNIATSGQVVAWRQHPSDDIHRQKKEAG